MVQHDGRHVGSDFFPLLLHNFAIGCGLLWPLFFHATGMIIKIRYSSIFKYWNGFLKWAQGNTCGLRCNYNVGLTFHHSESITAQDSAFLCHVMDMGTKRGDKGVERGYRDSGGLWDAQQTASHAPGVLSSDVSNLHLASSWATVTKEAMERDWKQQSLWERKQPTGGYSVVSNWNTLSSQPEVTVFPMDI